MILTLQTVVVTTVVVEGQFLTNEIQANLQSARMKQVQAVSLRLSTSIARDMIFNEIASKIPSSIIK